MSGQWLRRCLSISARSPRVKLDRTPERIAPSACPWPMDNNACENAIRPFVVGRRNWLFADTVAGANASANLYSLLQTCVANGIDGYRYLVVLLVRLPLAKTADDFEALLPWRIDLDAV